MAKEMGPTIIDDAAADRRLMDEGEHRAIANDKQSRKAKN
jgi:hypothetical protein